MPRRIALVMAGGGGTRLWPASVDGRPKQLLDPLLGGREPQSLLAQTVARLDGLVDPADVWVVVGHDQLLGVKRALPLLREDRFVVEPARRNTAPCIALSLDAIAHALGDAADDATVMALPADHLVRKPERLAALLRAACVHAERAGAIVTLGIEPDHPATGFGYLEREAERLAAAPGDGDVPVFAARRFVEKPDAATARTFLDAGVYLWNAGIFVMPMRRIAAELAAHCPAVVQALAPVRAAWAAGEDAHAQIEVAYRAIDPAPIDVAVMEKQHDLRVIPADIGWTDLGSWNSVHAIGTPDAAGNVCLTSAQGCAVVLDGRDNLVWSEDATIGVLGVEGLAVVASGGRILVCPLARAQEVKALLAQLPAPKSPPGSR